MQAVCQPVGLRAALRLEPLGVDPQQQAVAHLSLRVRLLRLPVQLRSFVLVVWCRWSWVYSSLMVMN
jgi:hypothetical protein